MSRTLTFLFIFALPLFQMAQTKTRVTANLGLDDGTEVMLSTPLHGIGSSDRVYKTKSKNGKFDFSAEVQGSTFGSLSYGSMVVPLYLEGGKDLELMSIAKSLEFGGSLGDANSLYAAFQQKFGSYYNETEIKTRVMASTIDLFELDCYAQRQEQEQYLKKATVGKSLSDDFKALLHLGIEYNYFRSLLAYPIMRANASKDPKVNDLPRIIEEEIRPELLQQEQGLASEVYQRFLNYYVIYFTSRANEFKKFADLSEAAIKRNNFAKEALKQPEYAWSLAQLIYKHYEDMRPSVVKRLFEDLSSADEDKLYVDAVEEAAGEYMEQKEEPIASKEVKGGKDQVKKGGKRNFPFELVDLQGKKTSIDNYRGKVVYVDFWASWCGPCKRQFPFAKDMKSKLSPKEKKQIVFLYISIDNDQTTWKRAVEKFGLEGENVYSPGAWSSDAASYFQVNSIPRYVLIDKSGKVIDGNAKRPSDPAILKQILGLL